MKYHLIGNRGISMQGLGEYLEYLGNEVTGSDLKIGGHNANNITDDIEVVVRSSAINPGSEGWVEVEEAERRGIKVIKRSQLLGQVTKDKKLIAVSGMHGKTTITTLAGLLLIKAGLDPTVLVGEKVKEFGEKVLKIGHSDWFVTEACEYDRSFLDLNPEILILTNIEEEHLDTYPGGMDEIIETFSQYLRNVKEGGLVIACSDDKNVLKAIEQSKIKTEIIYYGKEAPEYNMTMLDFEIGLLGEHNKLNALSIIALADYLKIERRIVKEVLTDFTGAKRRLEYKGSFNGVKVYDDYGHHPTEIVASIKALKDHFLDKKLTVVFWPHQYKRVKSLLQEFADALKLGDQVILKPIFFVPGRDEVLDVKSEDIANIIKKDGVKTFVMDTDQEIVDYLRAHLNKENVLLTIGIPPVYKIADELTK